MRLRSQRTTGDDAGTPRPSINEATPRQKLSCVTESPPQTKDEERTVDKDEEIPMVRRRPLPRGRARKRAIAVEDRETDLAFKTPIRPILRHGILSEIDPASPRNKTARNIYSPIVRFLTPSKENVEHDGSGNHVLMSPQLGVFGFASIDLLAGEEDEDIFNPFTFIKNIPSQSQHSRPQLRDIPPKTRSTPEASTASIVPLLVLRVSFQSVLLMCAYSSFFL